jgi:hypothetical protein
MPMLINKIVAIAQAGQDTLNQNLATFMKDVVVSWLLPAMDKAFILSISFMIAGIVVFFIVKIIRNYNIEVS